MSPLLYLEDGEDLAIVGSMGGSPKDPAWVHNLRAAPDTEVELRGERRAVRARVADAEERARLWPLLVEQLPGVRDLPGRAPSARSPS